MFCHCLAVHFAHIVHCRTVEQAQVTTDLQVLIISLERVTIYREYQRLLDNLLQISISTHRTLASGPADSQHGSNKTYPASHPPQSFLTLYEG